MRYNIDLHAFIDEYVDNDAKMLITYGKHILKKFKNKDAKVYNRYKLLFFTWMFYLMGKTVSYITPNLMITNDLGLIF